MAAKSVSRCLAVTAVLSLVLLSESWAQLSTGAAKEPSKLTPLPHPDIAQPAMLEPGISPWVIALAGVGLLSLFVLFLWLLFRKKVSLPPIQPPPLKQALERLERLRAQVDQLVPSEVAHQVSVILRNYQLGRYSLPAPYRTSEELYGNKATVERTEIKERFAPLSAIYDRIEFAPIPATKEESLDLIEAATLALQDEKRYQKPLMANIPPPAPSLTEPSAS
ncbi:hypothetical protein BH11VER1_BH11VER1_18660 [soil metagenome]